MARKYEIPIGADTSAFEKGVQNGIIEPLEDAEKALESLADTDAGRDIERDMEKAQRATDDFADEIEDARKELGKLGYAAKDAGDDTRRSMKRAEGGLNEFKDEANSTAKESAASFDGSAESIVDSFQEIAANAFQGFGPAGAVAGIAAAAGIGLAGAAFEANAEKAERMAEETANAFDRMIEAGGNFYTKDAENTAIADALKDPEKNKQILEIAQLTGLAEAEVARAVALTGAERQKVLATLNEQYDANNRTITAGEGFTDVLVDQNGKISAQVEKLKERDSVDKAAIDNLRVYDEATGGVLAKREAENELIRMRNKRLAEAPQTIKVSADTKQLQADINKALTQKSLTLVVDAIDRYGRKLK